MAALETTTLCNSGRLAPACAYFQMWICCGCLLFSTKHCTNVRIKFFCGAVLIARISSHVLGSHSRFHHQLCYPCHTCGPHSHCPSDPSSSCLRQGCTSWLVRHRFRYCLTGRNTTCGNYRTKIWVMAKLHRWHEQGK